MVTRLNFNLFNLFQSPDPGFQDCSERPLENLGSWIPEIEIQSFRLNFNLLILDSKIILKDLQSWNLGSWIPEIEIQSFRLNFNLLILDSKIILKDLLRILESWILDSGD